MKIGTKVQVLYPEKDNEEFGTISSSMFEEVGVNWYWVRFDCVSYTVEENRLIEVKQ